MQTLEVGRTYIITHVRKGIVIAKVIELGEIWVRVEVVDGRRFLHESSLAKKGWTVTLPLALTLFEEFQG